MAPAVYLRMTQAEAAGLLILANLGRDRLEAARDLADASRAGRRRRSDALSALGRLSSKVLTPELKYPR